MLCFQDCLGSVMSDKLSTLRECHMGEEGHVSWRVLFRRVLCQSEEYEFVSLLSLLSNVFNCRDLADIRIWKPCPS